MNLNELNDIITNLKLDNNGKMDYKINYDNLIKDENTVLDTNKMIDIFNDSINKCIQKDNIVQEQIDNIKQKLTTLSNKFVYKNNLCKEYITQYNQNKVTTNNLYELYNNNIINLCAKSNDYNKMINELLEQYNQKFEEYTSQIDDTYPKNFLVQVVINMIILTDMKNKSNILFKNLLLDEISKQKNEISNTIQILDNNELNKMIMNECVNIDELVYQMENLTNIKLKENHIENMIKEL